MHLDSSICILQHCLDYIRARDLICHFLFSFQTCQSLFTAVGEGCSLGIEASGVGSWSPPGACTTGKGQLHSAWSSHHQRDLYWDTGTTSVHRIRIVAQINVHSQARIKAKPTFLATKSAFP